MKSIIGKLFGSGKGRDVSYEQSKELAGHEDAEIRRELASQSELRPEILYFLTDDPSAAVRAEVAKNTATPPQADLLLAKDKNELVRTDLAAKISRLAPGLTANEKDQVKILTYETLELLARDQVIRVRQIIAETLKDVADAPPEIIRQLAWDAEVLVASPVLEFSPVLTDSDLIEIINRGSSTGRLNAISKRKNVSETVVDALVDTSDEGAIGLLLVNKSAQIREETLDKIINEAEPFESWHAPLVARPSLSSNAAMHLAQFVADNLLKALTSRTDIPPDTMEKVRLVVNERLEGKTTEPPALVESGETPLEVAYANACALNANGQLTEAVVRSAIADNQREFVVAALAVLTSLSAVRMEKAVRQKDPKGMVAIAWKAGLSVKTILPLQVDLAGISEDKTLKPANDGSYPMSESDMEWQFEVMSDLL